MTYANSGSSDIEVTFNSTNIKTVTSGGLLNCGVGDGAHTGGTYSGTSILSGKDTSGEAATLRFE